MKLHENSEDFEALIALASVKLDIADVLIEKDYWVTMSLKNLSQSPHAKKVVFKGGTSLSKAHKIIQRFSEDIDLAVIVDAAASSNAVKTQIGDTEDACSKGFNEVNIPDKTSKGSKFRKTYWSFPKKSLSGDYGDAGEHILIEVNSFTKPEPHEEKQIESLIAEYLRIEKKDDEITKYELEPFSIAVLSPERTIMEKVSAITKGCYTSKDGNYEVLSKNIRHFYDLVKLQEYLGPDFFTNFKNLKMLLDRVKEDDRKMDKEGEWTKKNYKEAPIFRDFDAVWKIISSAYNSQFKSMLYGDKKMPPDGSVKDTILVISKMLEAIE